MEIKVQIEYGKSRCDLKKKVQKEKGNEREIRVQKEKGNKRELKVQ